MPVQQQLDLDTIIKHRQKKKVHHNKSRLENKCHNCSKRVTEFDITTIGEPGPKALKLCNECYERRHYCVTRTF